MVKINKSLSNKLKVAVFVATIIVVVRHSINIHVYYPDIHDKGYRDLNSFIQLFVNTFTNIAVPLFFLLSGFLFFYDFMLAKTITKYRKRVKSLFLPYMAWNILLFIFFLIIQQFEFASTYSKYEVLNLEADTLLNYLLVNPICGQFWYIRDLILFVLISPLISLLLRIKFVFIFYIVILMLLWQPIDITFFSSEGILFFSLGAYLGHHKNTLTLNFNKPLLILVFLIWVLIKLIIVHQLVANEYYVVLEKVSIVLGMIFLWKALDYKWFPQSWMYLTSFSFFIYAFQSPLIKIFYKLSLSILPVSEVSGLLVYFIAPIVVVSLSVWVAKFLRQNVEPFYNVLTGNR